MKKWTKDLLEANGYELRNAYIKNVSFGIEDYGFLSLTLTLEGDGWGVNYTGPCNSIRFITIFFRPVQTKTSTLVDFHLNLFFCHIVINIEFKITVIKSFCF